MPVAPNKLIIPRINYKICKQCYLCAYFCSQKVIEINSEGYPYIAHPEKCLGCKLCFYRCPDFALEVSEGDDPK